MKYTPDSLECQVREYVGIGKNAGVRVAGVEALEYALNACGVRIVTRTALTDEFAEVVTEWFYSGDWLKEDDA